MTFNKLKIALVDDDEDDRNIFELAVSQLKINSELKMFANCEDIIKYLRQPDTFLPNILFLDLNMPTMNGLECLEELKKDLRLKDITIVIYSTSSSEKDIENTFLTGANIYLNKPPTFENLKSALKEILNLDWQYHTSVLNRKNFLYRF